jgi:hypothetical protein
MIVFDDENCVHHRSEYKEHVGSYGFVHERTKDKRSFRLIGFTYFNKGKLAIPRYQDFIVVLNRRRLKSELQFITGFFLQIFKMIAESDHKKGCPKHLKPFFNPD